MVRSIAVVSLGKGSGKTTTALNLGLALHQLNHKVLVFDTDFTKPNMSEHLELYNIPSNINDVLEGDTHIKDVIYKHITGMRLIPSMVHPQNSQNSLAQNYDKLAYHYEDLLGDYDYIILDTPSREDILESVLKNADEALIIHSPEYSSKNVMDAITLLNRLKVMNLGIVLNKSGEGSVDTMFEHPVLEIIPTHKDITNSFQRKNPLLHTHPKSKIAPKFRRLAKRFE
jgi:MinD-like ATPase involved in chromosome partitioning or flagellar assembly